MNFPPMMTEGSSRAFKFASSLPALGWEPVVIASDTVPGAAVEQLPFEVHYAGTGYSGEEGDVERLFRFVHGLPWKKRSFAGRRAGAARKNGKTGENGWEKHAFEVAERVLQDNPDVEMIYTQAPPFSAHRLGLALSGKYHLPVMFDCTASFADEKEEISIMHSGHCVTMPSREMKEFFLRKYRGKLVHDDISIVRNGHDPEAFDAQQSEDKAEGLMRWVFHIERAEPKELKNFFSGLSAFVESQQLARGFFSFAFTGSGAGEIGRHLKKHKLEDLVDAGPACSHTEEIELCRRADIYCMVTGKVEGYEFFVPERLYDVLGMSTSVAGVVPEGLAGRTILEAGGRTASIERAESIAELMEDMLQLWRSRQLPLPADAQVDAYNFRSAMQEFLREMAIRLPLA